MIERKGNDDPLWPSASGHYDYCVPCTKYIGLDRDSKSVSRVVQEIGYCSDISRFCSEWLAELQSDTFIRMPRFMFKLTGRRFAYYAVGLSEKGRGSPLSKNSMNGVGV